MRAEHTRGNTHGTRQLLTELIRARDADVPEDLPTDVYRTLQHHLPHLLHST